MRSPPGEPDGAQRRTGCQVITGPIVVAVEPLSSAKPSASCELRRLATSIAERVSASSVAMKAATLRPSEEKTELVEELSATSAQLVGGAGADPLHPEALVAAEEQHARRRGDVFDEGRAGAGDQRP